MENSSWSYFQYRKEHAYPIYLRFNQEELKAKFLHLLGEVGFQELSEKEIKKISLHRPHTRILSVQSANARFQQQIKGSDLSMYGSESLSIHGGIPVYVHRKVALLGIATGRSLWDLFVSSDLSSTDQMVGLRVVLVRFLSLALADLGVLVYWGTIKDHQIVIMKQVQSFGEAVLLDLDKKMAFCHGGEMKLGNSFQILRKDKEGPASPMSREELISFLSVNSCYMSFTGLSHPMKKAVFDLSAKAVAHYQTSPEQTLNL